MSKPKISVIITVYNTKKNFFRREVLGSLSQTYADFEKHFKFKSNEALELSVT